MAGEHTVDAYNANVPFDRNFAGPPELKPLVYRSQAEKDTWYAVVVQNEYRVPEHFESDDVVIDIGAHIGSFSWFAHRRGSRAIYAFEIDPWQMEAAAVNLGDAVKSEGVGLYRAAVVRSDEYRAKEYHYDGAWNSFGLLGPTVPSFSLDEIIEQVVEPVRFLKIDCEGGEWPILYTCTKLDRVQEIAGEYHEIDASAPEVQHLPHALTKEALAAFLQSRGFSVEIEPHAQTTGNFFAKRNASVFEHEKPLQSYRALLPLQYRTLNDIAADLERLATEVRRGFH